jgi:hypothetical protein
MSLSRAAGEANLDRGALDLFCGAPLLGLQRRDSI